MSLPTKKQTKTILARVRDQILHVIQEADADIGAVRAALSTHTGKRDNPHGVTATQVGARPSNWTPTAADVGAAPANHTHTASEVGAAAASHSHTPSSIGAAAASHTHSNYVPTARKVNNKALSGDVNLSASDVGAMPAIPGVVMSYDASSRTFVIQKEIGG